MRPKSTKRMLEHTPKSEKEARLNISSNDILFCQITLRNPFRVENLSWYSQLHRAAFRPRRRMSKRFVGRPAKTLFRLAFNRDWPTGQSSFKLKSGGEWRSISFSPRNTQFGALYMPQNQPIYEPETSALLDILVGDEDVFFDIGANWGFYAVYIGSRSGFRGRVEAFEPFPSTFLDLKKTIDGANLSDRVGIHGVALSDHDGIAGMATWDGVQSGLARLGDSENTKIERVEVSLKQLDSLDLPSPDVIKIDAEDHEEEVFVGSKAILEKTRPLLVFENWVHFASPHLTLGPLNVLADQGYRFFIIGWRHEGKDGCLIPEQSVSEKKETVLALIPFLPQSRFFLSEQLNILAVPKEKIDLLRGKFDASTNFRSSSQSTEACVRSEI